jgi:hypothetical protein
MKILILSVLFLPFSFLFSQGNLQFNRVVNYNLSGNPASSGAYIIQTISIVVPANKVWKIESATSRFSSTSTMYGTSSYVCGIILNNNAINCNVSSVGANTYLPMWLSAGTYSLQLQVDLTNSITGAICYGMITGIEFNIIP